jgi:hypothetical protein
MPDGNPKYEKIPRRESITFFEKGTQTHKSVSVVNKIENCQYEIIRNNKNTIYLYLNNIYIVGVADVHEIISDFPEVNCILTISSWNSYSNEAKALCKSLKIGLFTYQEYYGALYYGDDKFYNYEPPKADD